MKGNKRQLSNPENAGPKQFTRSHRLRHITTRRDDLSRGQIYTLAFFILSFLQSWMSQPAFLENPVVWHGEISGPETWWVARQEALEHAGYMLRPRYRPGWKPSWVGTDKDAFDSEDGQSHSVSADAFTPSIRAHPLLSCACAWTQLEYLTEDL